jgi:hypothetical protein
MLGRHRRFFLAATGECHGQNEYQRTLFDPDRFHNWFTFL